MFINLLRLFLFSFIFIFLLSLISIFLQRYKIIKYMPLEANGMIRLLGNISFSFIISVLLYFFKIIFYDYNDLLELLFLFCIISILEFSGIRNQYILIINKLNTKIVNNIKIFSNNSFYINYNAGLLTINNAIYIFIYIFIVDLISFIPLFFILDNKFLYGFIILLFLDLLSTFLIYINRIIKNNFIVFILLLLLPFSRVLSLWGMFILLYQRVNFTQTIIYIIALNLFIWILPNLLDYNRRLYLYKILMNFKIFLFFYVPFSALTINLLNLINNQNYSNILSFLINPELFLSFVIIAFGLYFYSLISFKGSIHIFEMDQEKKDIK